MYFFLKVAVQDMNNSTKIIFSVVSRSAALAPRGMTQETVTIFFKCITDIKLKSVKL